MNIAVPVFLLWLWDMSRRESAPAPVVAPSPRAARPSVAPTAPSSAPEPWPQVVPAGLPSFPGAGWEPDEPPPRAVQTRAGQLLSKLWSGGAGTFKIEHTGARWLAYRAMRTAGNKKGVVAYRLKSGAKGPAPAARRAPRQPQPVPPVSEWPSRRVVTRTGPATSTAPPPRRVVRARPVSTVVRTPTGTIHGCSPVELPTLRRGMGMRPQAPNEDVKLLQGKLGITADGRFGNGTRAAVKAFQKSRRLSQDGVVGPNTWTALFAGRA